MFNCEIITIFATKSCEYEVDNAFDHVVGYWWYGKRSHTDRAL
jgi:hypothetical protein